MENGSFGENFRIEEIEAYLRRQSYEDDIFNTEYEEFEETELTNLGLVIDSIRRSDQTIIPDTVDLDDITLENLTSVLPWQTEDKDNLIRIIQELTFALAGAQRELPEDISEAAGCIAHFEFLTIDQVIEWLRVMEDLTNFRILTGNKSNDLDLIADLELLEEERLQSAQLLKNIESDIVVKLSYQFGDRIDADKVASNLVIFSEKLYIQCQSMETEDLNYISTHARNELIRASEGSMNDEIITSLLEDINQKLVMEEYRKIVYPIFAPK